MGCYTQRSSPPPWQRGTFPATARYHGYTECVPREDHRGDHRDDQGVHCGHADADWNNLHDALIDAEKLDVETYSTVLDKLLAVS
jgi:hypothetical protein